MLARKGLLRGENLKKKQLSHHELKKIALAYLYFLSIWFDRNSLTSLSMTDFSVNG
jgi:hypothetical protein